MAITYLSGERIQGTSPDTYGTASWTGTGSAGSGTSSHDNYVRLPTNPVQAVTTSGSGTAFTIAFWVKSNSGFDTDAFMGTYDGESSNGDHFQLYTHSVDGLKLSDGSLHANWTTIPESTIENNSWHHIALTRPASSSTVSAYLDGVLMSAADSNYAGRLTSNTSNSTWLKIGGRGDNNDNYPTMSMQDLGFWTREVSASDIAEMATGKPIEKITGYATCLKGYYKFDGDYTDSSSNTNTGIAGSDVSLASSGGKFDSYSTDDKATLVTAGYKSAGFDGANDNAISAGSLGISLGNNYSFGGWANPEAQSSSIGMALYMAGALYLYRLSGVWKTEGNGISITGSTDVGVDSWKHVMVNVVSGTATLYIDGVADGTDANTNSSVTISQIQMGEEGTSYEYKGNLTDWFFYSRALTTAEIASLVGGAKVSSISQTNLEANYTFDSNLNDRSSNSRHLATVTGDVTGGNTKGTSPITPKSNLPENTLFEETDTRFVYFLQSNVWENSKQPLNMTFADQTAADLVWNPDTTNTIRIDVSNKYLFDSFDSTTGTFTMTQNTYDLGSNLDTTWTVQFTLRASNFRSPTSSNYTWFFGMWSLDSDSNANTTQDRLLIVYDTTNHFQSSGANAAGDGSLTTMPTTNPTLSSSTNSTEYFVTLQKTGTTGYKVVLRTGSHSGTILSTHSPTWQAGTPSTFRYFGMKTRMANSSRLGAIIKDVTVYDGALVG